MYFDTIVTLETEVQCGEEFDLYKYVEYVHKEISKTDFKSFEQQIRETVQSAIIYTLHSLMN